MNETRARLYQRLMEAEDRIARALYARGTSHEEVDRALDLIDELLSEDERGEDLYLAALEIYVGALGGRLEVRTLFGDEAVIVRQAAPE